MLLDPTTEKAVHASLNPLGWRGNLMQARPVGIFAVILFSLAACGSGPGNIDGGTGGGGSGGGGSGGGGSGGGGSGGGGTGSAHLGFVTMYSRCDFVGGACPYGQVFAGFGTGLVNPNCTTSTIGGCQVTECDGGFAPRLEVQVSAGTISVIGTKLPGAISLTYSDAGYYQPASRYVLLWDGGEPLTVGATGDTVPAFSGKTVTAPSPMVLASPLCTSGQCYGEVSRSVDLTVSWPAGGFGEVYGGLYSIMAARTVLLDCPLGPSPATIRKEALARLDKSDAGASNVLMVCRSSRNAFTVGSYDITVAAHGVCAGGAFVTSE